MKLLFRSRPVQWVLPPLLGRYLGFLLRSNRWTLDGADNFAPYGAGSPAVFTFWHEHLLAMPALALLARRMPGYRPIQIHTLVSQHADGQFIGSLVRRFGIEPVLGSSTRGGPGGFRQLLRLLQRGAIIGITPDGPRGPRRVAAPGVAQLAALSGVPVLPCAARTTRRIELDTWDHMGIPLPFGCGVVVCEPAIQVPRDSWHEAIPAITNAMNRAADRADRLCTTGR
jgi:lysophospholipid acyltransferase (LPLAT)-like uncharacterized protein